MPGPFIGRGVVRKLWAGDTAQFAAHLQRLDRDSRIRRFMGLVSDEHVAAHARNAVRLDTVIYGYFDRGVLRAAAEMHPLGGAFSGEAEGAFSVELDYQEHGVGTELFRRVLTAARNRGVRRLTLNCLPNNLAMRRLCEKFGAKLHVEDGEAVAHLVAVAPTPLSWMTEAFVDGTGIAKAMLDARLQALRTA
jgi:RimJ/RimL family protein N-acetyltransferase